MENTFSNGELLLEVKNIHKKFADADGIVVGTPVYYAGANGNIISFLDRCEGILLKMPFILSKNKKDEKIKNCIEGITLIHFYLVHLSQMSIYNSKFGDLIFKYYYEFSLFIDLC